jgi:hypothetical protein
VRTARVLSLEFTDDALGSTEAIETTAEHPFFARVRGWTPAAELLPGDEVFTSRGGWARVGAGTWLEAEQLVYNLTVEDGHTYFVGETGAWVHNLPCPWTSAERDVLRQEARDIWEARTGRRALWDGLQIHHRIPLEYGHLFPNGNPNRVANLVGMEAADHSAVSTVWTQFRTSLAGATPTQAQVMQVAQMVDGQFGHLMTFLP